MHVNVRQRFFPIQQISQGVFIRHRKQYGLRFPQHSHQFAGRLDTIRTFRIQTWQQSRVIFGASYHSGTPGTRIPVA